MSKRCSPTRETRDKISKANKGHRHSDETKKKISDAHIGYKHSEIARKRMSAAATGRKHTEECKRKLSIVFSGDGNPNYGKHHSMETKRKISEACCGAKNGRWKGGICTPERLRYLGARRRALECGAKGSHTQGEWELLKKQYGHICPACGRDESIIKLTEDHIIPLSRGGSNSIENIQPLCKSCNSKKYTKVIKYG